MTGRVLLIACLWAASATAHAWQRVVTTERLAADRPFVELQLPKAPGEAVRVELRGTITHALDGTRIDAVSRWNGDTRIVPEDEARGPWVRLPSGARVVERDPASHRYEIEVPRTSDGVLALDVRRLAHEHFVTPDALRASVGAIEVRTVAPAGAEAEPVAEEADDGPPTFAMLAAGTAFPVGGLLLFGLVQRRRRRRDAAWMRRGRAAVRTIEREVQTLGPAFEDVAASSRRTLDAAAALQRQLHDIRAAIRRTRHLEAGGARARREELVAREAETLGRMRDLVEHLETTATHLAAHAAGSMPLPDLDRAVRELRDDLDLAVSADAEARAG